MSSPQSKAIRASFVRDDQPSTMSIEQQRAAWEAAVAQAPLPPGTTVEPLLAGDVPCERVRCAPHDPTHVMLYLHGGGFNAGSCKTHRELAARLSLATGVAVLLIEYRLAPEHPFPAALDDTISVYRWLVQHGTLPDQVVVGSDSAGAALALAALVALRDSGDPLPAAAVFISPWIDLALTGPTLVSRAQLDPLISQAALQAAVDLYIDGHNPHDPHVSPLYADLHNLPPLLIHVGDHEQLLSDATRLADKARAAGVDVALAVWPEMWHVWHAFAASVPEAQAAIDQIGAFVRATFAQPAAPEAAR